MGKNPCPLCSTPDVRLDDQGNQHCWGCGVTSLRWVTQFSNDKAMGFFSEITFIDATMTYERSPFPRLGTSFGEWLCQFRLKMVARL